MQCLAHGFTRLDVFSHFVTSLTRKPGFHVIEHNIVAHYSEVEENGNVVSKVFCSM